MVPLTSLSRSRMLSRPSPAFSSRCSGENPLHRKAQWRLDCVAAENSMGFHAPQESARLLGEAIDYARQGQEKVLELNKSKPGK